MAIGILTARKLMRMAAERHLGFLRSVNMLGKLELKYKWTAMRADYSKYYHVPKQLQKLKFIAKHHKPTLATMSPKTMEMSTRYRYTVVSEIYNPTTREVETYPTKIRSNRLRIRGGLESEAEMLMSPLIESAKGEYLKSTLVRVENRDL